jgi:hypothetical protein
MDQKHPMHGQDRLIVDRLLAASTPTDADITDCARLLMRYLGYPGAKDIQQDLARSLGNWRLDTDQLYAKARRIWSSGWRPTVHADQEVGSGADVNAG